MGRADPLPTLLAHDLARNLGGRPVLDGVSPTASPGHRISLIGENGAVLDAFGPGGLADGRARGSPSGGQHRAAGGR